MYCEFPNRGRICKKIRAKNIGRFSGLDQLDQKRSGTDQTRTSRMENGMISLNTCCWTLPKVGIPNFVEPVLWNEEFWKAKEVENCLYTSVVIHKLLNWFFARWFPSAQCLRSSSGYVWRTGLEDFWLFNKHGETCCSGQIRDHVSPTDLSATTEPLLTNEHARGDLLREYKRKFANLPDDLRLIRLCSDAGFMKTVSRGQYFVTLDEAQPAKLDGACREYTLPRDEQLSKVKGWIRGDTKIGPVLEVTVSYHQGRYGIEIRINSIFGDGSHSWVLIENGLNKYVMEMSEEIQQNLNDEIGASAGRLAANARPKQTSLPRSSSPTVTQTTSTRSFRLSRRRRSSWIQNSGTDVCITIRVVSALVQFEHGWGGGGPKKRFQYCLDPYSAWDYTFEQFKAILKEIRWVQHCKTTLLPSDFAECIYHVGSSHDRHSIIQPGLISGGKDIKKGRQTAFFTVVNINTSSGITTWRSPELQCTNKFGKYTRTQCTGPICELLRRRDWRSVIRDLTRSSFATLYQRRVLRRWLRWVQEKYCKTKYSNLLFHREK